MVYKKRKSWFFCFEIREMYKNTLKYIDKIATNGWRNRRKAVVLLGTGQSVPEKLKKRLIKKDIPQSGKKKISVKKCGQIILLVLQGRVYRQECSIRLPSGMKDISQLPHRIQSIRSNRWSLLFVRRSAHWAGSDIYGLQNIFQKVERIWKPGCWKQKRKYVVVQLLSTTEKVRIEIASFTYCNYMLIYLYKHFSFRNIFIRWKAKQMSKRKGFSKLNLLNRFLFNEAMEDPENMKTVLDIIFGQDIPLRLALHSEKEVRTLPDNRMKCEEVPILICKMMRHAFFWTAMVKILKWYHRNW